MDLSELKNVVLSGHERTDVDFKRSKPWDGGFRYKLIKAVLAFSNAGGGYIVIGIDEEQDGTDNGFSGISIDDRNTWDVTKVNRDINNYAEPSIDINLADISLEDGTKLLVVEIPTHGTTPHICVKARSDSKEQCVLRKGAVYYRSKNKECLELSDPNDWQVLINRCVFSRREELFRDFQQITQASIGPTYKEKQVGIVDADEFARFAKEAARFKPVDLDAPVYVETLCYSSQTRMPTGIDTVNVALKSACVDYRGWPFLFFFRNSHYDPVYGENTISAVKNEVFFDCPKMYYWAFDYSDGIFYSRQLTTESEVKKPGQIDPVILVKLVAEAVIAMGRLHDSLGTGLDKLLKFTIRLSPIRGVRLMSLSDPHWSKFTPVAYAGDAVAVSAERPVVDFTTRAPRIAAECIVEIAKKMGAKNLPSIEWFEQKAKDRLSSIKKIPDSMM